MPGDRPILGLGGSLTDHDLLGHELLAAAAGTSPAAPRAQLTVWPDLSTDVDAVLATLPDDGTVELVWEDENGSITSTIADDSQYRELAAQVAGARAAAALSLYVDDRHPLFTAVLLDDDGVLRARWRTEPTPSDRSWAFLKTLHRGQICTGTVTEIASFGVTFVDIDGFTVVQVGDTLHREGCGGRPRRRIILSHLQALASGG